MLLVWSSVRTFQQYFGMNISSELVTDLLLFILHSPWRTLGHVDTAIYGAPSSGITRRQVQ